MVLCGKTIYLRSMEREDMEMYREMINDEGISKMVVGWSFPVSREEQISWFEHNFSGPNKRFTICLLEDDRPVGLVTLSDIDMVNRSAFHGIKLHPSCPKRKGIGTDAVMTLMEYAFNQLNLHRLNGSWLSYNEASRDLYLKCGWQVEGIQRKAVFRDGEYYDLITSGILKSDYINLKDRLDK